MGDGPPGACVRNTGRVDQTAAVALAAADRLALAAAPAFAAMALFTAAQGAGPADLLCGTMHGASPLSGMSLMYALMSLFHSPPWLRLLACRRRGR